MCLSPVDEEVKTAEFLGLIRQGAVLKIYGFISRSLSGLGPIIMEDFLKVLIR